VVLIKIGTTFFMRLSLLNLTVGTTRNVILCMNMLFNHLLSMIHSFSTERDDISANRKPKRTVFATIFQAESLKSTQPGALAPGKEYNGIGQSEGLQHTGFYCS